VSGGLRIIVTGLIAQHPRLGGVAWDYVQYAAGLSRLGHDVYYFEDSGEWPYNEIGGPSPQDWVARDCSPNVEHLARTLERFGLRDRWAYRFPLTQTWFGLSDRQRSEIVESADVLLNVSGTLEHPEEYRAVERLVYVDSDPVFTQVRLQLLPDDMAAFRRRLESHDVCFSFGELLGEDGAGRRWHPTRQPIVLDEWHPSAPHRDVFTTVMSWTSYRPFVVDGVTYAQKDVEFGRFLDLPVAVREVPLEVALGKTEHVDWEQARGATARTGPRELLRQRGWRVVDASRVCRDLDAYRKYVESSAGEWSVAKNGYVLGQPGWFSCRSACYLAAGRPVILQETGFSGVLPVGEGILSFRGLEEAAAAVREVISDYRRHARAARELAEAYFDHASVLSELLQTASGPDGRPSRTANTPVR
jgi:hypothetical protein